MGKGLRFVHGGETRVWPGSRPVYPDLPMVSPTIDLASSGGHSRGHCGIQVIMQDKTMARILLAEDDEDLRRFLVSALEKAGHTVTSFGEGASAFEEIKQETFDLLLTDIVMPEMDGIELARRAAELDPALKIMFITGFAAVALNPDSKAPKEAKVLSKPFHLRDLVNEVNRLMAA
jgi:two-component system cell cycle response regulator CpdR